MNLHRYKKKKVAFFSVFILLMLMALTACTPDNREESNAIISQTDKGNTTTENANVELESEEMSSDDDFEEMNTEPTEKPSTEPVVTINKTMYAKKKLAIYKEANLQSEVLSYVYSYSEIYVKTSQGGWSNISYNGNEGYINSTDFLETRNPYTPNNFTQSDGISDKIRDLDPNKPMIALTFDDGPSVHTAKILDALEANNQRATFFVIGKEVKGDESTVQRAYKMGCQIGIHTYSHPKLTLLSKEDVAWQVNSTVELLQKLIPVEQFALRPPYGAYDDSIKEQVKMPFIMWSVDTKDWETLNAEAVYSAVVNNAADGKIYLMHDVYLSTANAAVRIINTLTEKGYQLVTIEEMAYYKGVTLENGKVYKKFN